MIALKAVLTLVFTLERMFSASVMVCTRKLCALISALLFHLRLRLLPCAFVLGSLLLSMDLMLCVIASDTLVLSD